MRGHIFGDGVGSKCRGKEVDTRRFTNRTLYTDFCLKLHIFILDLNLDWIDIVKTCASFLYVLTLKRFLTDHVWSIKARSACPYDAKDLSTKKSLNARFHAALEC